MGTAALAANGGGGGGNPAWGRTSRDCDSWHHASWDNNLYNDDAYDDEDLTEVVIGVFARQNGG